MHMICHTYTDCINFRICQHLLNAFIRLTVIFFSKFFCPLQIQIIKASQLCIRIIQIFRNMTNLCNLSTSYNPDFYHLITPFMISFFFQSLFHFSFKTYHFSEIQSIFLCYTYIFSMFCIFLLFIFDVYYHVLCFISENFSFFSFFYQVADIFHLHLVASSQSVFM